MFYGILGCLLIVRMRMLTDKPTKGEKMKPYKNLDSGITAYDIFEDYIIIQFKKEKKYRYDESCVGKECLENMNKFAQKGDNLNTYINKNRHIHECGYEV